MGQEFSCAGPRKAIASLPTFEQGVERVVDSIEQTAEQIEGALDDALRPAPARPSSHLSDREREAAVSSFYRLLEEQGRCIDAANPVVYEDTAMASLMQQSSLLEMKGAVVPAPDGPESLHDDPAVRAMLLRLHAIPVGHWLQGDRGRKGYTLDDWLELVSRLQGPRLRAEEHTVPIDDPLPVSALLQLEEQGVLVCGCGNSSTLDQLEHMLDAQGAAIASARSCVAASSDPLGSVRPLGALVLYEWSEELPDHAAEAELLRARERYRSKDKGGAAGGGGDGSPGSSRPPPPRSTLRSYLPLTAAVTALAYCRTQRLLLVGTRTGSVQASYPATLLPCYPATLHAHGLRAGELAPTAARPPRDCRA